MAAETIVKPQIPFYFSPVCNVLLPNMYSNIQVSQSEQDAPTRVSVFHSALPDAGSKLGITYRAPPSIRESLAIALENINTSTNTNVVGSTPVEVNLLNTTGPSYNT